MLDVIEKLLILRDRDKVILEVEAELRGLTTERAATQTRTADAESGLAEGKDKAIFAGHLWKVEGKPDPVYGIFMEAVGSAEGSRRHYGFQGLQLMGPQAKAAVPALQDLLQQEKTSVRTGALKTLAAIGPGAVAAAPLVQRQLKAPDKAERALAQEALDAIQVW